MIIIVLQYATFLHYLFTIQYSSFIAKEADLLFSFLCKKWEIRDRKRRTARAPASGFTSGLTSRLTSGATPKVPKKNKFPQKKFKGTHTLDTLCHPGPGTSRQPSPLPDLRTRPATRLITGPGPPLVDRQTENITFPSYSVCGR